MNNTQKALINQDVCEQTTPNLGITQSSGLEKQKAASATYTGDSWNLMRLLRFRMSIRAKPVAAQRKPVVVWSMESQWG